MTATPATSAAVGVVIALRECWDALDCDFRHHYGLDLEECCFGPDHIGVRRLYAYISRLPATSAYAEQGGWSWDESREMNATLIEIAHSTWDAAATTAASMTGNKYKGPKSPFKWPRPGESIPKKEPLTIEGVRATLLGR